MASCDYDGHQNQVQELSSFDCEGNSYSYNVGIKNADANVKFVMGAPFKLHNITTPTGEIENEWLKKMNAWFVGNRTDGKFIFDVINFHHYSLNEADINDSWKTPEEDMLKQQLSDLKSYATKSEAEGGLGLVDKEFWLSEFGYDTDQDDFGPDFPELLDMEVGTEKLQAQWTVRSFLEIAAAGFDRAMVHDLRDASPVDQGGNWDQKTGLLLNDGSPKMSWFYVYTMKNALKGYKFVEEAPPSGCDGFETGTDCATTCPRVLKFQHENTEEIAWVVWSPTSCNIDEFNFPLDLECSNCGNEISALEMADASTNGKIRNFPVSSNGFATIKVSETPIFIFEKKLTPPMCPEVAEMPMQSTCTSIALDIDLPDNHNYHGLQIWYGVASEIAGQGVNFDALEGNVTQFQHDVSLTNPNIIVSGLSPGVTYGIFVIPQTDTGLALDGGGNPCAALTATTKNAGGICKIEITPQMITGDSNTEPTDIEGYLFDQQNDFDFCQDEYPDLSDDDIFLPWVDFNNDDYDGVTTEIDLLRYYNINQFFAFDAESGGVLKINYAHSPDGPWLPLTEYFTSGLDEWVTIANFEQPVDGVRYLQFINDGNNARLKELFICGEESCLLNPSVANESHCFDYNPEFDLGWLHPSCKSIQFRTYNEPVEYKTVQLWYSTDGPFVDNEHPQATHPNAETITVQIEDFSVINSITYPAVTIQGLMQNTGYYFSYRMLDNEGRSTPLYIMDEPIYTANCLRPRFMIMGPMVNECSQVGIWWSLDNEQRGGYFEVIETEKKVEDPTKSNKKYAKIPEDGTLIYQYLVDDNDILNQELSELNGKDAQWLYLRYVDEAGNTTDWIVWDLSVNPCERVEGRSNNGVTLGSIPFYTNGIQLYPNPTKDLLYLELEDTRYQSYQITDVMGKLRLAGKVKDVAGEMKLNVAQLQGGVYILHLEGEGIRAKSFKFVVSE